MSTGLELLYGCQVDALIGSPRWRIMRGLTLVDAGDFGALFGMGAKRFFVTWENLQGLTTAEPGQAEQSDIEDMLSDVDLGDL